MEIPCREYDVESLFKDTGIIFANYLNVFLLKLISVFSLSSILFVYESHVI